MLIHEWFIGYETFKVIYMFSYLKWTRMEGGGGMDVDEGMEMQSV